MEKINYNNKVSYYTKVVFGNDLYQNESHLGLSYKKPINGQESYFQIAPLLNEFAEYSVAFAKFYKEVSICMKDYIEENNMSKEVWIKYEGWKLQEPGTEDPQIKNVVVDYIEGRITMLYFVDECSPEGTLFFPKQGLSINPAPNSLLIFPSGEEYSYEIKKISKESRRIIEMVAY
jgi:hypothetical protein